MTESASTIDGLLNKRVQLEQPASGYRVAIDTVLLAASVPALAGDSVLDLGCGVGGAMICLACRAEIVGLGVENQKELVDMGRRNIERNAFAAGLEVKWGDVADKNARFGLYDHVLMNPPYHEEARHNVSPDKLKEAANIEKDGDLGVWIETAARSLKTSGTLTLIHRADRLDEILGLLRRDFGEVEFLRLLPRRGEEAKRVIVRARKAALFSAKEYAPLVLHGASGAYTTEADEILRNCQELVFQSP